MVIALGALAFKVQALGVGKVAKSVGTLQKTFGNLHKKMKPALENLQEGFGKLGFIAGAALWKLIAASPRLRAEMELLNIRVNQLLRGFGDELAPIIRTISNLIKGLTEWFEGLPEPLQKVVLLTGALTVALGALAIALVAVSAAASPIVLIIIGIAAVIAILYVAWEQNWFGIKDTTAMVCEALKPFLDSLIGLITDVGNIIVWLYETAKPALELLEFVFALVFAAIGSLLYVVLEVLTAVIDGIRTLLNLDFGGILDIALGLVSAFVSGVLDFFGGLLDGIAGIVGDIGGAILGIAGYFTDLLSSGVNGILGFVGDFYDLGVDIMNKLGEGIKAGFDGISSGLNGVRSGIRGALGLSSDGSFDPTKMFEKGVEAMEAFSEGIKNGTISSEGILADAAALIGEYFGGSLPERGKLKNIVHFGNELGETYVKSIGTGLERAKPTEIINRTFNIENITLEIPETTMNRSVDFMNRLDIDLRKATQF